VEEVGLRNAFTDLIHYAGSRYPSREILSDRPPPTDQLGMH